MSHNAQLSVQIITYCQTTDKDVLLAKRSVTQATGSHPVTVTPATSIKLLHKLTRKVFH